MEFQLGKSALESALNPNVSLYHFHVGLQLNFVAQWQVELQLRKKCSRIRAKPNFLFLSQLHVRSQVIFVVQLFQLSENIPKSILTLVFPLS
jgi:hypothetical protein